MKVIYLFKEYLTTEPEESANDWGSAFDQEPDATHRWHQDPEHRLGDSGWEYLVRCTVTKSTDFDFEGIVTKEAEGYTEDGEAWRFPYSSFLKIISENFSDDIILIDERDEEMDLWHHKEVIFWIRFGEFIADVGYYDQTPPFVSTHKAFHVTILEASAEEAMFELAERETSDSYKKS